MRLCAISVLQHLDNRPLLPQPDAMSHIYIYSPSSAVRDKAAYRRGVARLKALGHEVEIDEAALASHMRFAGDDETRLAAIGRAAASGADVALISRGGYGLTLVELAQLVELPLRNLESRQQPWTWRDWQVLPLGDGRWRLERDAGGLATRQ